MTARGWGLLLGGAVLLPLGWEAGWPELTVLGVAAVALVMAALLLSAVAPQVTATVDVTAVSAVRGERAQARVTVRGTGGSGRLRLVSGSPASPAWTLPVPRVGRGREVVVVAPLDTSRRGEHQHGPYTVLAGDVWSIVRRVRAVTGSGSLLVRPRIFPVRRGFASVERTGDSDFLTRQSGDDHFFALRDYVLGDEPRNVHWRSSARSGRLVVKQRVAAATDGVLIVLDVDAGAYPAAGAFGEGFLDERFEQAVEVAASLARSRADQGLRVHFATTARSAALGRGGIDHALLALVAVQPTSGDATDDSVIAAMARQSRSSSVLVVTGDPGPSLRSALQRARGVSPVLVRVGAADAAGTSRLVVHVPDAAALA